MKSNKPQLTISLLISNRIETIPRCLDSLSSIMDAIPCELILTDTSKNPDIHKMLLEYTDQVYEFEWCNDFANARNLGLEKANGEWFMFLDDDEWFADATDIIQFFKSGEYLKYGYATYQVRNFLDKFFCNYKDGRVSRLVKLSEDTRFEGKVHEYFSPMIGAGKGLDAIVYHTGYIYETPDQRKAHFERNHTLLVEMIKEEPDNMRLWIQLAQEYSYSGEHEQLIEYCVECLEKIEEIDEPYVNAQRGVFYTGVVSGCVRMKEYARCIKYAKKALADNRIETVARAMMYLRMGEAYLKLDEIACARREIEKYFDLLCKTDFEAPAIKKSMYVFLAGEAFSKNSQELAYAILISCGLSEGNDIELKQYYDKLHWSEAVVYTMEDIEKYMVGAMFSLEFHPIYLQIVIDAFGKFNLRNAFCREILLHAEKTDREFQKRLYLLVKAMQVIIDGPTSDLLQYNEELKLYVRTACEWYDFIEKENMLELFKGEVPCYLQAAMKISDYLEIEVQDKKAAWLHLRDAVESMPEFATGIGCFLEAYQELIIQKDARKNDEMITLRKHVMCQVKELIQEGQREEARQIMIQLRNIFPEDDEILDLLSEIEG